MGCGASSPRAARDGEPRDPKHNHATIVSKEVVALPTTVDAAPGWHDPTRRYQGRPHATSLAMKPFHVHTSTASFAANAPCEDTMCTESRPTFDFAAVFDGHGGGKASAWCREHTFSFYDEARVAGAKPGLALRQAIEKTEQTYFSEQEKGVRNTRGADGRIRHVGGKGLFQGSCAIIVHVDKLDRSLTVANLGDSRAVLAERDREFGLLSSEALTFDHKASSDYERNRLACLFEEYNEGDVVSATWDQGNNEYSHRVCGLAEFTRSIGDYEFKKRWVSEYFNTLVTRQARVNLPDEKKPWVSATPTLMFRQLHTCHEFVIVACDGLWDEISSDAAVHAVGHFFANNPEGRDGDAAAFLLAHVMKRVAARIMEDMPDGPVQAVEDLQSGRVPKGKHGLRNLMDDISVVVVAFDYGGAENVVSYSSDSSDSEDENTDEDGDEAFVQKRKRLFSRASAADYQLNTITEHARRSLAEPGEPVILVRRAEGGSAEAAGTRQSRPLSPGPD